jgi:hypothetical protein
LRPADTSMRTPSSVLTHPPPFAPHPAFYDRLSLAQVLRAVQSLQRSVPTEHKDDLRAHLKPLGWTGYKLDGLTPNKTRRAQVARWLIYYREALHGVSIEELRRRRDARAAEESEREAAAAARGETIPPTGTTKQSVL